MLITESQAPELVWAEYAKALGPNLQLWFGDHWPPPARRPGERVYLWQEDVSFPAPRGWSPPPPELKSAAWLSLIQDQMDPKIVWMSRGVWPEFHGQNLGKRLRTWAVEWCRDRHCTSLNVVIRSTNPLHLSSALADPFWKLCGVVFGPPPEFLFEHVIVDPR